MEAPVKCPNCGSELNVRDPGKTKMLYCPFCMSSIDLTTNTATQLYRNENMVAPPKSALHLGCEGNINGIKYMVIGRVRYRDSLTYQTWDEWLLLSENGNYLWLQEEDWEFVLMHKYTPKQPFDPATVGKYVNIDGLRLEVEDNSSATLLFFEGELTWRAEPNESIRYIDAWKDEKTLYSCEWSEKEIMYFIGKEIPVKQIYAAFNLGEPPAEALEEEDEPLFGENWLQRWVSERIKGPLFKFSLILGLTSIFFALFVLLFGTPVFSVSGNIPKKEGGSYIYGPYKFTQKDRIYRVDTKMNVPRMTEAYCEIEILDKNKDPVLGWDADFWHEEGYDSDGHWSESVNSKTAYFVLKDPGEYYLEITPENPSIDVANLVTVKIKEGVFHNGPLWTIAIVSLIYPGIILLLYIISNSNESD